MSFRLISLLCFVVHTPVIHGADLQVREGFPPPFYSTIQSAIEAAVPGDNVLVYPGTYNERINFLGKDITGGLRSAVSESQRMWIHTIHFKK